ncbi:ribonuclease H-like domain-containing protein [Tanacetum coccineum]
MWVVYGSFICNPKIWRGKKRFLALRESIKSLENVLSVVGIGLSLDQDCNVNAIWDEMASYFDDVSLKSVADAQIQDQDGTHDDCSLQDNGTADQQVNTASPEVNTGSREVSTAVPESSVIKKDDNFEAMRRNSYCFNCKMYGILVDLPKKGHRAWVPMWVYINKKDEGGFGIRNKSKIVAKDISRRRVVLTMMKSFAPVARIEAIRIFLAYASYMGFTVYQWMSKKCFPIWLMKRRCLMSLWENSPSLGLPVSNREERKGIFISQDKYVHEILRKFNYTDVKSASTPTDLEKPLVKDADARCVDLSIPLFYRSMIGLFDVNIKHPDRYHVCSLWYSKDSPLELVAYTDSDYAGAILDRKSTTGDLLMKGFDAGRFQDLVSSIGMLNP